MSAKKIDARLPKRARLLRRSEFDAVFGLKNRFDDRYFTLYTRHIEGALARLGLVVSKRVSAQAVTRNRIKRHSREAFRQSRADLSGLEIIVVARPAAARASAQALRDSLAGHFRHMIKTWQS